MVETYKKNDSLDQDALSLGDERRRINRKNKFKELNTIGTVDAQVDSIKNYLISYNTAEYDDSLVLGDGEGEEEEEEEEEDEDE